MDEGKEVETTDSSQVEASEKISVEIDPKVLDGWVTRYEKSLRRSDRSGEVSQGNPMDTAVLRLTEQFFTDIGKPEMIHAAINRQKIKDLKSEEESRVAHNQDVGKPDRFH